MKSSLRPVGEQGKCSAGLHFFERSMQYHRIHVWYCHMCIDAFLCLFIALSSHVHPIANRFLSVWCLHMSTFFTIVSALRVNELELRFLPWRREIKLVFFFRFTQYNLDIHNTHAHWSYEHTYVNPISMNSSKELIARSRNLWSHVRLVKRIVGSLVAWASFPSIHLRAPGWLQLRPSARLCGRQTE
jgi:hypothetical protein